MKRGTFLLMLLLYFFVQCSFAQRPSLFSRSYKPAFDKGLIKDFLDDINRNSGIILEYASNCIDTSQYIILKDKPATLGAVLQQVLAAQKIEVVERNNKIILVPSETTLPADAFVSFYSFYGIIKETESKEPLPDASIWDPHQQRVILSNRHGYYTLLLPEGKHTIWISYAGYNTQKLEIDLASNLRKDILLVPKSDIDAVTITSGSKQMNNGAEKIGMEESPNNIVLGEPDMVRSLYLLPGVQNIPEISSGMLVRGGSPDQNVFLLDGNAIFNPTHMLGLLSIVNNTSLKSMQLYKSNFPARYGGGLSSVVDVFTKDGNMKKWKGEANAGLLAGSFTLEGPLKKDRTAVMISLRNSWVNPFLRLVNSGVSVNFYDIDLKLTQIIGKKDKLMLNAYAGHDKLNLHKDNSNNQQQWGNKAASLTWNRILGHRAFVNSSLNINNYKNIAGFRYNLYDSTGNNIQNKRVYNTFSSIEQYGLRSQLEFSASNDVKFNIGAQASYTRLNPFNTNVSMDFIDNPDDFKVFPPLTFRQLTFFYENEIKAGHRFFFRPGIHMASFQYLHFHHTSWQPRFYAACRINSFNQLDISYNHMVQYLHLLTNPYLGVNSDAWFPSTGILKPEESDMVNIGYTWQNLKKWVLNGQLYYKQLRNVSNYAEGKNLFLNDGTWENNVQSGKGWTYGLEAKAEKKAKKWEAGLSYTLSWNWRKFDGINDGKKFPFKYDRRHQLTMAVTYKHNSHLGFSALWTFSTGDVFTLPDRIYPDFDVAQQITDPLDPKGYRLIYHSSSANQYRTLPYHRLDLSSGYHHRLLKKMPALLTLGIYNIYGSPAQYVYDVEGTFGKKSLLVTTQYKFFSITPYLSYTVSF